MQKDQEIMDTKEKILESAQKLFIENGFHKTSMSSIADKADVGKGTLYWHFSSKKELFVEMIRTENKKNLEGIHKIVESDQKADKKLKTFIRYTLKNMIENKEETQMFLNNEYYLDEKFKDALLDCLFNVVNEISLIVEEGVNQGVFCSRENDPDQEKTTVAVLGSVNIMASLLLQDREINLDEMVDFLYDFISNGIKA